MKTILLLLLSVTLCSAGYVRTVRNPDGSVGYEYVGTPEECRRFRQWQAEFERQRAAREAEDVRLAIERAAAEQRRRLEEIQNQLEDMENNRHFDEFNERLRNR